MSSDGEDYSGQRTALAPVGGARLLPSPSPGSPFRHYCQTSAPLAVAVQVTAACAVGGLVAGGVISFGAIGAVGIAAIGAVGWALLTDRAAMVGNGRLERRVRERLGAAGAAARDSEFVGLGEPDSNEPRRKLLSLRVETDDAVGLLEVRDDALCLHTDGGSLVLAADAIRSVTLERMVEVPLLHWIRISFEREDEDTSVLVTSRQASSLRGARAATRRLYATLVDWHTERQLRWLALAREGG